MRWNTSFSVFVVLGTVKNYATAANENKFYFCYIQQWMSWSIFRVESSKRGGSANFAVFFAFYKYFLSEFCNGNSRVNTKSCIPKRSWQAQIALLDRFLQKSTVLRPENTKGEGCHPGWSLPPNVSEHNSRNRLSAVSTRGHMPLSWIAFTRGSEQPGAATPFVWRTATVGQRAQPEGAAEPAGALHLSEREMRRYCRRPSGTGCPLEVRYRAGRENTIDGFWLNNNDRVC